VPNTYFDKLSHATSALKQLEAEVIRLRHALIAPSETSANQTLEACEANQKVVQLQAELNEADRRAGAAERKLAEETSSRIRRNSWLREAKREWGAHKNASFNSVWEEALAL
jgi:hypothetical protein